MRLPGEHVLAAGLLVTLVACAGSGEEVSAAPAPAGPIGPAADYPVTIGDPYAVAGVSYTPTDTLNYDQVGTIAIDTGGGTAISAAHHTLPVPCYVEVTSLETGRTILVRVERRGPMDSNALIALSPGAADQLGAHASTPVRVRRVNPPEQERALLRAGERAPARMDTPMSLVEVLKRKLPGGVVPSKAEAPVEPGNDAQPASPDVKPKAASKPERAATSPAPSGGTFMVQAGAFASEANAQRAAKALGGQVSKAGSLHIVRTGPFATRAQAQASLAKVKAAGYSDARIQTKD